MEKLDHQIENQEVIKPPSIAEQILADVGIQEGAPIGDDVLQEIIRRHKTEITEGLSRNFYHPIKRTLYQKLWQPIHGNNFVILPVRTREERPDRVQADFILYLEELQQGDHFKRNDGYKLVITCAAESDRIKVEERRGLGGMPRFTGTEAFSIDRISTSNVPMVSLRNEKTRVAALRHDTSTSNDQAEYKVVQEFLDRALVPPEKFPDADASIDSIFLKNHLPLEDVAKLKQAIWEFGNYDYRTRKGGFEMIGDCLVIPLEFEGFVRQRYGINLEEAELSGAYKQRDDYTVEELAELAAEKAGTAVHFASVYHDTVIIDWTSRQFDSKLPIPEIIDLYEDRGLKSRIEILGRRKK